MFGGGMFGLGPRHDRKHFFKYTSCKTAKIVLENRTFQWSLASAFNDPFDVQFDLQAIYDAEELIRISKDQARDIILRQLPANPNFGLGKLLSHPPFDPKQRPDLLDPYLDRFHDAVHELLPKQLEVWRLGLRNVFKTFCIFCLSTVNDNVLIWSHYADQHRGVVIRLACLEGASSRWLNAAPVVYSKDMPRLVNQDELRDFLTGQADFPDNFEIIRRSVLTKALDWRYEEEWRVADNFQTEETQFIGFHPSEIDAIYFGCRISEQDRADIMTAARKVNSKVEFHQAKKSDRAFALKFEPIA